MWGKGQEGVGTSGEKVASKTGSGEDTRGGLWPQGQAGGARWERGLLRHAVLKDWGLGGARRGNLDRPDGLPGVTKYLGSHWGCLLTGGQRSKALLEGLVS